MGIRKRGTLLPLVSLLAASAVAGLVGCASNEAASKEKEPEAETSFLDLKGAEKEYIEASKTLPLPPGERYPASFRLTEAAPGSTFEVGVGASDALRYYWCEWEYEFLDSVGRDEARQKVALAAIQSIPENEIFKSGWDQESVLPLFREIIDAAELGDPSRVQAEVEANCRPRKAGQ